MDRDNRYRDEDAGMPIGLAMALSRDAAAMYNFGQMNFAAQDLILARAREAQSRDEMQQIVAEIGGLPGARPRKNDVFPDGGPDSIT